MDFSLSIMPWTFLNSSTWQGILMVPFWSKPYSSSASFNNCMNSGWLKYMTGTTNLCCSSPWPTLIAKHPFGTSLACFLWWWRWGRCRWKFLRLFSPLPIIISLQKKNKRQERRKTLGALSSFEKISVQNKGRWPRICCHGLVEEGWRRVCEGPWYVCHGWRRTKQYIPTKYKKHRKDHI